MDNQTSKSTPIKKAVIPIAGLGTRFLPATRSIPKPLLPVLNVPVIEYAVREAVDAGVTDIAIIMSPGMESVADYFKPKKQLERELAARGNAKLYESQLDIASLANLVSIYQHDPKGPGHAIMQAKGFCNGDPFLVIFPDDLIIIKISATEQLLQVYREHGGSVIAVTEAPDEIIQTRIDRIINNNQIKKINNRYYSVFSSTLFIGFILDIPKFFLFGRKKCLNKFLNKNK